MSFSDTANAKKYASIAETAAAQAKLSADNLKNAPEYAEQAAASAVAAASSAEVAVSAQSVVNDLSISASESATSAAASAASAGDAAAAAISRSLRVPDGEQISEFPAAVDRAMSVSVFDGNGSPEVRPVSEFATLDSNGKIPVSIIPAIALTEPFVVASQAEMLALPAQTGDIAKRTDLGYSFCLAASPASTLSNWVQLTDDVLAQLGQSSGAASVGALDDAGSPSTVQAILTKKANKVDLSGIDGSKLIGNGKDTVNNFLYHTPEEFSGSADTQMASSLSASLSDGRSTWLKGSKTLTTSQSIPSGVKVINDGTLISSATTSALQLLSGAKLSGGAVINNAVASAFRIWQGMNNAKADNVTGTGAITSATQPAYAVELYQANDFSMREASFSGYSGAINLQQTNRAVIQNLTSKNMAYHASLDAGGYGVLTGGANDTLVNGLQYVAGDTNTIDGYTGRHAIYHSVLRVGGVNFTCANAIFSNVIANYRDKTVESAAGINIRANSRAIYSNVIIDGSHVSGIAEDGAITAQIFSQGIIRAFKRSSGVNKYGFSWGGTLPGGSATGNITANSIISVSPSSGISDTNCYAYEVTGSKHVISNLILDVPGASIPMIVRGDANGIIISDIMDPATNPTAAFILFEGGSNISLKGIKTNRPLFSGIFNVTDLTVDFPRVSTINISSGTITRVDSDALFESVVTSPSNIAITFRKHVTQAAINGLTATPSKGSVMAIPVITSRANKVVVIEFYALSGGALINPSTGSASVYINLSS